jgi:hypothetical protein
VLQCRDLPYWVLAPIAHLDGALCTATSRSDTVKSGTTEYCAKRHLVLRQRLLALLLPGCRRVPRKVRAIRVARHSLTAALSDDSAIRANYYQRWYPTDVIPTRRRPSTAARDSGDQLMMLISSHSSGNGAMQDTAMSCKEQERKYAYIWLR